MMLGKKYTVTGFCKVIEQPHGGFIPLSWWKRTDFGDLHLNDVKTTLIQAMSQGLVVEYLSHAKFLADNGDKRDFDMILADIMEVAQVSSLRFEMLRHSGKPITVVSEEWQSPELSLDSLLASIHGLDDDSIRNTFYAVQWDNLYRAGKLNTDVKECDVPKELCENVRKMVDASVIYLNNNKEGLTHGGTFTEDGQSAYTEVVVNGDYDYASDKKIIEFKVSKYEPKPEWTLQTYIYYLLGNRNLGGKTLFPYTLDTLAIYNPRMNCEWTFEVKDMPKDREDAIKREMKY